MHWKIKSVIQNSISLLPKQFSYPVYYWLQRHFGNLHQINPISGLVAGIDIWERIINYGYDPTNKIFLEVGTGRIPLVPLSFWLMGAKQTITIDLNPYLKEELVKESIDYIIINREKIEKLFDRLLDKSRLDLLVVFYQKKHFSIHDVLNMCQIQYIAPGDAAKTKLPPQIIDFHISYYVLEHISPNNIEKIFHEGNRILCNDGLFIHRIDYSDHFSHQDKSISPINFLQYSEKMWQFFAGNRYMYMNRLRHDDFIRLFKSIGHIIIAEEVDRDESLLKLLEEGKLKLNDNFSVKSNDILSITAAWIISKKG